MENRIGGLFETQENANLAYEALKEFRLCRRKSQYVYSQAAE